jgi:tetratricopeptide (TPR) repeat protein
LEQKGLLSAAVVGDLGDWLVCDTTRGPVSTFDDKTHFAHRYAQLEAVTLAASCLLSIEQYEDCVSLVQPLVYLDDNPVVSDEVVVRSKQLLGGTAAGCGPSPGSNKVCDPDINQLSAVYCIAGKCYNMLDHRARALRALVTAVKVDPLCTEAAEYLLDNGLLSQPSRNALYNVVSETYLDHWIVPFYKVLLLNDSPLEINHSQLFVQPSPPEADPVAVAKGASHSDDTISRSRECRSAGWLARKAAYCFEHQKVGEAYRLSRHAYSMDPYDERGLLIYLACMVELHLKTELFYLGHELVSSSPQLAVSWYAVGCYYWCCGKLDLAKKHLIKSTKVSKRFYRSWLLLGHVLSCQEESEQAIAAYRTASRLLPGDQRPMVCLAKELVRTHALSPALHLLMSAFDICSEDPCLLNEIGVTYMKQGSLDLALSYFEQAVQVLDKLHMESAQTTGADWMETVLPVPSISFTSNRNFGAEVFIVFNCLIVYDIKFCFSFLVLRFSRIMRQLCASASALRTRCIGTTSVWPSVPTTQTATRALDLRSI